MYEWSLLCKLMSYQTDSNCLCEKKKTLNMVGIVKRKSASLNSKKDNNLFDLSIACIGAVGSDHDFGSRVVAF